MVYYSTPRDWHIFCECSSEPINWSIQRGMDSQVKSQLVSANTADCNLTCHLSADFNRPREATLQYEVHPGNKMRDRRLI